MAYLLGLLWCLAFGGFGWFLVLERRKHASFVSFVAEVESVATVRGRHTAVLRPLTAEVGEFEVQFQDLGDFNPGQMVDCMWDGRDQATAQQDLRQNQRVGATFCFAMVALMVVILSLASMA